MYRFMVIPAKAADAGTAAIMAIAAAMPAKEPARRGLRPTLSIILFLKRGPHHSCKNNKKMNTQILVERNLRIPKQSIRLGQGKG